MSATLLGAPCGYLSFDDERIVCDVNLAGAALLGRSRENLIGDTLNALLPLASRIFFDSHLLPLVALQGRADEIYVSLLGPEGEALPVLMNAVRTAHEGRSRVELVFLMMRRRNLLERELVGAAEEALRVKDEALLEADQARARLALHERLASLGTLAAGVAHEINNPLAYVTGNLELIEEALRPSSLEGERLRPLVREAREGAQRIRDIVNTLRTLSRIDETRVVPVDLRRVVDVALRIAGTELRQRTRVELDAGPLPIVHGDEGHLSQVIINLLVNAAQALPPGAIERNLVRVVLRTDDEGWAVLEVRDNGPGVLPEVQSRIFDPFFTTKPVGQGTGLGLSLCHGIVAGLGGALSVESEPGEGACFRVVLPPASSALAPALTPTPVRTLIPPPASGRAPASGPPSASGRTSASGPASASGPPSARATLAVTAAPGSPSVRTPSAPAPAPRGLPLRPRVLVVDDDPLVASVVARALTDYDVHVELNGRTAVGRVEAGEAFDLLLCDIMMPEMSGIEVHAAVSRADPALGVRTVFMTGGVFNEIVRSFLESVPNRRLAKPFTLRELRLICATALAQADEGALPERQRNAPLAETHRRAARETALEAVTEGDSLRTPG